VIGSRGKAEDRPARRGRPKVRGRDKARRGPRTGARRRVMAAIALIPKYLRLLGGLLADRRVELVDKLIVAGAITYVLMPADLVPDFIPFFGQVDDVFLVATALQRLISRAGRRVVLDHWTGPASELTKSNLRAVLLAAAFFLPRRVRRALTRTA
jgi:uncharacterized membrane protein YkvA (DUF1232 family)